MSHWAGMRAGGERERVGTALPEPLTGGLPGAWSLDWLAGMEATLSPAALLLTQGGVHGGRQAGQQLPHD